MDSSRLVFLDEYGVNTDMTRLYGRGTKNERVVDAVPDTRFHQTMILSSVRLDGATVPCVFGGALNGELFREYIRNFLVPSLRRGDIVVMDNLSSHKVIGVVEAIEAAGAAEPAAMQAGAGKAFAMTGFNRRHAVGYAMAKRIIAEPGFGRNTMYLAKYNASQYGSEAFYLFNHIVHHLDLARFLCGEIELTHAARGEGER